MAQLIRFGDSNVEEFEALQKLEALLPDDHLLTTKLRDIAGRELDSVLICPYGILYLELKNLQGEITPKHYGAYSGRNLPLILVEAWIMATLCDHQEQWADSIEPGCHPAQVSCRMQHSLPQ